MLYEVITLKPATKAWWERWSRTSLLRPRADGSADAPAPQPYLRQRPRAEAEENKHIIEPTDTRQINIYQKAGYVFWTDILSKKTLYDRASFTDTGHTAQLQFIKHVQEINSDMGVYYIDEVNVNKNK